MLRGFFGHILQQAEPRAPGIESVALQWRHRVLTTGPPGKFHPWMFAEPSENEASSDLGVVFVTVCRCPQQLTLLKEPLPSSVCKPVSGTGVGNSWVALSRHLCWGSRDRKCLPEMRWAFCTDTRPHWGAWCVTSENCCPNSVSSSRLDCWSLLLEGVECAHGLALLGHSSKPLSLRPCLASGSDFFHLSTCGVVVLTLVARTECQSLERLWHSIDSMATESPTCPVTTEPAHDHQSRKQLLVMSLTLISQSKSRTQEARWLAGTWTLSVCYPRPWTLWLVHFKSSRVFVIRRLEGVK